MTELTSLLILALILPNVLVVPEVIVVDCYEGVCEIPFTAFYPEGDRVAPSGDDVVIITYHHTNAVQVSR